MLLHFVVDLSLLALIESGKLDFTKKWFDSKIPDRDTSIQLDSDVQAESQRVEDNQSEVIRVSNFRKAY
jgi:hypothetical protein